MLLYQPGQISKIYVGEQRTIGDRDSLKHLERLLRLQDQETRRLKNTKKTVETRSQSMPCKNYQLDRLQACLHLRSSYLGCFEIFCNSHLPVPLTLPQGFS